MDWSSFIQGAIAGAVFGGTVTLIIFAAIVASR